MRTRPSVWETWVARFKAKDYAGLYDLYSKEWRRESPFEEWKTKVLANLSGYASFIERARYAGTKFDGDRARLALNMPGSPRPFTISLVRVDGEWRFAD